MTKTADKIKVTLVRSPIGRQPAHRHTVKCLGLRRIRHSVIHENDPRILGMIKKIDYMLKVETVK